MRNAQTAQLRARTLRASVLAIAAFALATAGTTSAQTPADLNARVQQLEATLAQLQQELSTLRQAQAKTADDVIRIRPTQTAAAAPAKPEDGFKVGATTFKLGGYVKAEALYSDYSKGPIAQGIARDFYVPGSTPVTGASEDAQLDMHAKQTRITLTATRDAGGTPLTGYIEADFQSSPGTGTELVTNAYNLAVRRATISYGRWLFGEDWSTFQNVAVLPESADFIGPTEGTVFERQPVVRYTHPISKTMSFVVAAENPETTAISLTSPTGVGFDDDPAPDVVARFNWAPGKNQFSFAAIGRQLKVQDAGVTRETSGWGVSASGKVMVGAKDELRFMLTHGEGVGRYVALHFAADAVFRGTDIDPVPLTSGFAAFRHVWSDKWRSTFSYAFIDVDNAAGITPGVANDTSSGWFANLFYAAAPGLDLGVELRQGTRETFNGQSGDVDRLHLVAKQSF